MFAPAAFTHDPRTGARTTQYADHEPVDPLPDPAQTVSRYWRTRTNLRGADGSSDTIYEVRSFGNTLGGFDAQRERGFDASLQTLRALRPFRNNPYLFFGGLQGFGYGFPGYPGAVPGTPVPQQVLRATTNTTAAMAGSNRHGRGPLQRPGMRRWRRRAGRSPRNRACRERPGPYAAARRSSFRRWGPLDPYAPAFYRFYVLRVRWRPRSREGSRPRSWPRPWRWPRLRVRRRSRVRRRIRGWTVPVVAGSFRAWSAKRNASAA